MLARLTRTQLNDLVGFVVALAAYKVCLLELPHQSGRPDITFSGR